MSNKEVKVPQWEKDMAIDKFLLEEECEKQAIVFTKYALEHVSLLHELDTMKLELDEARRRAKLNKEILIGECDTNIRKTAERQREKITEAVVKARISMDEEYLSKLDEVEEELREVEEQYIEVKAKADKAAAIREGFKQRKDMLGHEVFLWGASYYADPPTEDKVTSRIKQSMNKKKEERR